MLPQRLPERILEKCVKGMLPKGRIASPLFNHLKVCGYWCALAGAVGVLGCAEHGAGALPYPCTLQPASDVPVPSAWPQPHPSACLKPQPFACNPVPCTPTPSPPHSPPASNHPPPSPARSPQVYKGAAHPHEAQRPIDITSRISKKPSEAL